MSQSTSHVRGELLETTDERIASLTLRIEATLTADPNDIPILTPALAATVASLLYPHGRGVAG